MRTRPNQDNNSTVARRKLENGKSGFYLKPTSDYKYAWTAWLGEKFRTNPIPMPDSIVQIQEECKFRKPNHGIVPDPKDVTRALSKLKC